MPDQEDGHTRPVMPANEIEILALSDFQTGAVAKTIKETSLP
jgi:hypothetical protein